MGRRRMGVTRKTLKFGDGNFPNKYDEVTVHYTGWLKAKGKNSVFDSSRTKGRPFKFVIGHHPPRVIQGWEKGVLQMSLGERAELDMTSDFGYGARGTGGVIPPDADLIFDIQLLAINGEQCDGYEKL